MTTTVITDHTGTYCQVCENDATPGQPCPVCEPGASPGPLKREAVRATTPPARHPGTVAVPEPAAPAVEPSAVLPPGQARPQPVDGVLLWVLVRRYLAHYVAFRTKAELDTTAAWIFHACARKRDDTGIGPLIWRASPRLLVTSRDRGSGKSTLLDLIVILTQSNRGKIPKITPARIAQVIGKHYETVVLDEAKTIFGSGSKSLELQGVMLSGYTRRTSYEISGKSYSLFGAIAYAGKDELITDTSGGQVGDLLDRSVIVRMLPPSRRMPEVGEQAEDDGELLARALVAWTNANRAELVQAARDISVEDEQAGEDGNLRTPQITRPLRAVARVAGQPAEPGAPNVLEAEVCMSLAQLTEGAASTEAQDAMAELQRRSEHWGDPITEDEDEPGRIVISDDDESEE